MSDIRPHEKQTMGEVFTPRHLVDKLLDGLPPHVWTDPDLRWLEPTCGRGAFYCILLERLLVGLATWEPDSNRRLAHIMDHMLLGIEINPENVDALHNDVRRLFSTDRRPHVLCNDLFDVSPDIGPFDIIVGNPPFNAAQHHSTRTKIYERVLCTCLHQFLAPGGHMAFVCPDTLFGGSTSRAYDDLVEFTCVRRILLQPAVPEWQRHVQVPICLFWARQQENSKEKRKGKYGGGNTLVEFPLHGTRLPLSLKARPLNPVRKWTARTEELVRTMVSPHRNDFHYHRGRPLGEYKSAGGTYPLFYTPSTKLYTSDRTHAVAYGIPKVIVYAMGVSVVTALDRAGTHGVGPNIFYLPLARGEDGIAVMELFASESFRLLAEACKTNRRYVNAALIRHLVLPV